MIETPADLRLLPCLGRAGGDHETTAVARLVCRGGGHVASRTAAAGRYRLARRRPRGGGAAGRGSTWRHALARVHRQHPLYEPCDVLFRDADALRELGALPGCTASSDGLAARAGRRRTGDGPACNRGVGMLLSVRSSPCRRVDLPDSWDAYLQDGRANAAPGFLASEAKLASRWRRHFRIADPDPAATGPLLDEFVAVEASSWKWQPAAPLSPHPRMEEFFREVLHRFAARGQLWMCFLRCGGRAVAAQLGLLLCRVAPGS